MKMVRSLLLGSAAGLVAVAGAQAADLPVKAKPVQYVKICSLYGVGFYYIPGTDMCLKIGGWVRAEGAYGDNGNMTWGPFNANANNRTTSNSTFRARGYITADARNQTEYGTVRGYIAVGLSTSDVGLNTAANQFSANRAFIQWAGFTLGLAQSFYDFYSVPATSYWGNFPASDTGDPGWFTMGYTAQFGNGFSATVSVEERRITQIVNQSGFTQPNNVVSTSSGSIIGAFPSAASVGTPLAGGAGFAPGAGAYGGFQMPDIVANLRIDQAWGSAQIMGALHQVNASYYTAGAAPFAGNAAGHPDDKLGWVVGAGFKLNATMIGVGDFFQMQANYTEGALKYIFQTPNSNWSKVNGADIGWGTVADAVFGGTASGAAPTATDLNLTTAWNVNAAYEHFWSPRWRTSVYGGYAAVSYGGQANAMLCANIGGPVGATNGTGAGNTALATAGCDNNWNTYWVGTRTQWNVTKDFYMGVDVLYQKLDSAQTFNGLNTAALSPLNTTATAGGNQDNWAFRFRAHRDFYP